MHYTRSCFHPSYKSALLEMLFPKSEPHPFGHRRLTRLPDLPCRRIWPTKVHTHIRPLPSQPIHPRTHIAAIQNPIPHPQEQLLKIRTSKIRPRIQLRQRILLLPNAIEHDVLRRVKVNPRSQIRMYPQEVLRVPRGRVLQGLGLERGQKRLKPFEGGGVFAHPDELDPP